MAFWEISHSTDTESNLTFAWDYWANVTNWSDPPARFELNGKFETGAQGSTLFPGRDPMHWYLRKVIPYSTATIEIPLDNARLSFEWNFVELSETSTRLTQRIALDGEEAGKFQAEVEASFQKNLPEGMKKLSAAIAAARLKTERVRS